MASGSVEVITEPQKRRGVGYREAEEFDGAMMA
mgnify:FL=1